MAAKHADRRILKLAIAGALPILALTFSADAQVATGNNGRALDANNRVGSGGINGPGGSSVSGGVTQNQIIYGNVTGGKGFTGPVGERDPGAFFGPTSGGISDRFIASSSGAPQPYQPSIDLSKPQPFYGSDRFAAAPLGSVRVGFTGTYVGNNGASDSPLMQNPLMAPLSEQSQQLGQLTVLGTKTTVTGNEYGEQVFQASLDNGTLQSTFSGSPLYGIQSMQGGLGDNTLGLGDLNGQVGPNSRFQFQNAEERRMQSELQQPNGPPQPNNPLQPNTPQQQNGQQNGSQSNGNQSQQQQSNNIQQPLESIDNTSFGDRSAQPIGSQPMSTNLQTGGGTQQRFTLVAPEIQSTQYSELKKRLERYQSPQQIATQQQIQSQRERRAVTERGAGATSRPAGGVYVPEVIKSGQPGVTVPQPGVTTPPRVVSPMPSVTPSPVEPGEPMKISSLATGVNARGLHELLASGEALMHDGKFQSAIDKYNMAQRIAPNNPLVPVGLASAQLGAGAYRNASDTLHQVFQSAEPTLMAQYNIAGWMPADRLQAIKGQLTDLSAKEKDDETPEFLLAYIAYNTGDTAAAKQHLDEARKRSDGKDKVLDRLQTDWNLSAKTATPDLNK